MKKLSMVLTALACLMLASCSSEKNLVFVELKSNPTTGFSWACQVEDESIASLTEDLYTQDNAPKGMVGVGGKQKFVFECKKQGSTKITFTYRRPWEGGETAEVKTATLSVDENLCGQIEYH